MAMKSPVNQQTARVAFFSDPTTRSLLYQTALGAIVIFLLYGAIHNAIINLQHAHIASGFGFWNNIAGFDISLTLIQYSASSSTYGRAFWVSLLNTLLVASLGIVFSTILGFAIGISRLSSNWLLSRLATGYVELIRNVPLLLQLLFLYNAVLKTLPELRDGFRLWGGGLLNNRGLFLPQPIAKPGFCIVGIALLVGIASTIAFRRWAQRRLDATGEQSPVLRVSLALVIGLPLVAFLASGSPLEFSYPEKGRFNVRGGIEIVPEFAALLAGLVIYTAAFIAEVVRAGILSVSHGQSEAAYSLGLPSGSTLWFIVIPQAMRVIIPPLTSQYLNLTKNSTLAVAIGYPDLVQVFAGTVLNQTGQAVEVIVISIAVYLTISLVTSIGMNIYQAFMAPVER